MTICSVCSLPAGILRLPWLRFFRAFSSVVRQMPGYTSQRRGTVRTLPNSWTVLFYVLFVSIVLFYVLFVCKCVLYYCHRVSTQLQLNVSYRIFIPWCKALWEGLYTEISSSDTRLYLCIWKVRLLLSWRNFVIARFFMGFGVPQIFRTAVVVCMT